MTKKFNKHNKYDRQNKNPYNDSIYYSDNKYKVVMKNLEKVELFDMMPTKLNSILVNNKTSNNTLKTKLQKLNKLYTIKSLSSKIKHRKQNKK